MTRLFLSYSRTDQGFAQRIAADLDALGVDVWLDMDDIPAGMKWSSAIQQGLDNADIMIVLITPASMSSQNVEDEWQYFRDQKKPIVPVLLEPSKIHFQLSRIQYVDFHKQPYHVAFKHLQSELVRKGLKFNQPADDPDDTVELVTGTPGRTVAAVPETRIGAGVKQRRDNSRTTLWIGLATFAVVVVLGIIGLITLINSQRQLASGPTPTPSEDTTLPPTSEGSSENDTLLVTKIAESDWTSLLDTDTLEVLAGVYHTHDWEGLKDYLVNSGLEDKLNIPAEYIGIIVYRYKSGSADETLQFAGDHNFINENKQSYSEFTLSSPNDGFVDLLKGYSWLSIDEVSSDGKTIKIILKVDQMLSDNSYAEELLKTFASLAHTDNVEDWQFIS